MDNSLIKRQVAIDAFYEMASDIDHLCTVGDYVHVLEILPSAEPEPHEIGYSECADAMLKMWIDNVLTDGEYNRIMDKLNAHWTERREE